MDVKLEDIKKIVLENLYNTDCHSIDDIDELESFESMGADSLDKVELIMEFEDFYNITIKDDDSVAINTVNDIVVYIANLDL